MIASLGFDFKGKHDGMPVQRGRAVHGACLKEVKIGSSLRHIGRG